MLLYWGSNFNKNHSNLGYYWCQAIKDIYVAFILRYANFNLIIHQIITVKRLSFATNI